MLIVVFDEFLGENVSYLIDVVWGNIDSSSSRFVAPKAVSSFLTILWFALNYLIVLLPSSCLISHFNLEHGYFTLVHTMESIQEYWWSS